MQRRAAASGLRRNAHRRLSVRYRIARTARTAHLVLHASPLFSQHALPRPEAAVKIASTAHSAACSLPELSSSDGHGQRPRLRFQPKCVVLLESLTVLPLQSASSCECFIQSCPSASLGPAPCVPLVLPGLRIRAVAHGRAFPPWQNVHCSGTGGSERDQSLFRPLTACDFTVFQTLPDLASILGTFSSWKSPSTAISA